MFGANEGQGSRLDMLSLSSFTEKELKKAEKQRLKEEKKAGKKEAKLTKIKLKLERKQAKLSNDSHGRPNSAVDGCRSVEPLRDFRESKSSLGTLSTFSEISRQSTQSLADSESERPLPVTPPSRSQRRSLDLLSKGTKLHMHYNSTLKKRANVTCDFVLDQERLVIEYTYTKSHHRYTLDVGKIREIRVKEQALRCKGFQASQEHAPIQNPHFAFTIFVGSAFDLQQICLVASSEEDFSAWTDGLLSNTPMMSPHLYTTHDMIQRYLLREWEHICPRKQLHLGLREVKNWFIRINCKLTNREVKEKFSEFAVLAPHTGECVFTFDAFCNLYRSLNRDLAAKCFAAVASVDPVDPEQEQEVLVDDLLSFFRSNQNEPTITRSTAKNIIKNYGEMNVLKLSNFVQYLHSKENSIFNPAHQKQYCDMTQPLAHYFINSSHNTYLMQGQLTGESSVEAYIRALRDGCRCVEIDCWDAKANNKLPMEDRIIVYHGHTFTTQILFKDVVVAIKEHMFDATDFPLILSIENHCSREQQKTMAALFVEAFGDALLTEAHPKCKESDRNAYPSPEQLRRRVIIKFKKLKEGQTEAEYNSHNLDDDMSGSIKNGMLLLEDKETGLWKRKLFVLTASDFSHAEQDDEFVTNAGGADDVEEIMEHLPSRGEDSEKEELHYGEAWFHGSLQGGRKEAEVLIRQHLPSLEPSKRQGVFLVRKSLTYVGEFSLSFWRQSGEEQTVRHCRIRFKNDKYFLTDIIAFESLYELIEYYRREELIATNFSLVLGEAVPMPAAHIGKKWFHADVTRSQADRMLRRVRTDGMFLIRESEANNASFSISFRAEGKVRNCRIQKEGRMYTLGSMEFESLVELVEYYTQHPLMRKTKLTDPIDEELLALKGDDEEEDFYSCGDLYQTPNEAFEMAAQSAADKNSGDYITTQDAHQALYLTVNQAQESGASGITCRSLYEYRGTQGNELSFPARAIITNVQRHDSNWWQGDYGDMKKGWLPSNFVEEIDFESINADAAKDEVDGPLGQLAEHSVKVDNLKVEHRLPVKNKQGVVTHFVFRVTSNETGEFLDVGVDKMSDAEEWVQAIENTVIKRKDYCETSKQLQKTMKIAKELSDLVFYCQSVKFRNFEDSKKAAYQHMSSFKEWLAVAICSENKSNSRAAPELMNQYNCRQISRVYPKGTRTASTNYDPQTLWNCGVQMAALNFQTPDRPMWLNHGKFNQNGNCGYILKPSVMRMTKESDLYNPYELSTYMSTDNPNKAQPLELTLQILAGLHFLKSTKGKGMLSPYVEVEIVGVPGDCNKYKTKVIADNGINPVWFKEVVTFQVNFPEMACLCVTVNDEDAFGDSAVIAQCVLPVGSKSNPSLRQGWRSVPLRDRHGCDLDLASLLVHCDMNWNQQDEYQSFQVLKQEMQRREQQREQLVQQRLQAVMSGGELSADKIAEFKRCSEDIITLEAQVLNGKGPKQSK
eukprot:m.12537 g.12537  ORF g.12537 m.12537 type:complete len:1464 (-) comp9359_c0_seq1:177-4568(-)